MRAFYGKPDGELVPKYIREGESQATEGWFIDKDVVLETCTDFTDFLFETVVKSS